MKSIISLVICLSLLQTGCKEKSPRAVEEEQIVEGIGETVIPAVVDTVISRVAIQLDEGVMNQYAGLYELRVDPSHIFTVSIDSGFLYFTPNNASPVKFYAESDTTFFNDPSSNETLGFAKTKDSYTMLMINTKGQMASALKVK